MKQHVWLPVIVLMLTSAITFHSCSKFGKSQLDIIRVGLEDQPKTLDPRFATDANGMRISQHLLFSTLVQLGYDLQIVPDLAERWEIPNDTTYIFYLKSGVVFHDGSALTAEDVKFTFEHLRDTAVKSPFASTYKGIKTIIIKDAHTVEFHLDKPDASFLTKLIMSIIPKKAVLASSADFATKLTGSGPYRFVSQSPNEIILERNKNYFKGAPKSNQLIFEIVKDNNTRFLKMKKGELDLAINVIQPDKIDDFKKPPLSDRYEVIEQPSISYNYLALNMKTPDLQNRKLREAIANSINVEELIKYQLNGHAVLSTGLLSPVNWFYEPRVHKYSYDSLRAVKLLDSIGKKDPDGAGPKQRLTLELKTSNNTQSVEIGRILQAQFAKVGIKVDLKSFEWATYYNDVKSGAFQMAIMQWAGVTEPDFYYDIFHSSQFAPAGRNRVFYANPRIDQLTEEGRITLSPEKRKLIYSEIQKIVAEDLPYVSLWHSNNVSIVNKRIAGYIQHPTGGYLSFGNLCLKDK